MNQSKISIRYSRALFQSALENGILDKVNKDMIYVLEISKIPEIKEFLHSPIIVPSKKTAILHKILGNELHELSLSLIDLIVKNGREISIPAIARVFIHETMKQKGITESFLTSAVRVDSEIKKRVSDLIADIFKTKADLKESVDENIIGGFILRIGDNYIDASVRSKLAKIRRELTGGSFTKHF